jgi:hypothetical protein
LVLSNSTLFSSSRSRASSSGVNPEKFSIKFFCNIFYNLFL